MPRSRAKIRAVDDSAGVAGHRAALGFDERVRSAFASDAFGAALSTDVAEAAAALSAARPRGRAPAAPPGKAAAGKPGGAAAQAAAAAQPAPRRVSVAALPKPLRHLLAGAFSGGARSRGRRRARRASVLPVREYTGARARCPRPPPRLYIP